MEHTSTAVKSIISEGSMNSHDEKFQSPQCVCNKSCILRYNTAYIFLTSYKEYAYCELLFWLPLGEADSINYFEQEVRTCAN